MVTFIHGVFVRADEEADGVFIISARDWEGDPIVIYINEEEARTLLWQLSFFIDDVIK